MKNRICLAWFGDLDAKNPTRPSTRKDRVVTGSQQPTFSAQNQPKVKEAWELRRMFRRP